MLDLPLAVFDDLSVPTGAAAANFTLGKMLCLLAHVNI